jgi:F-type H+-transporting ATPase subunit delta
MPKAASARRYAQAVFQIALESGELERWMDDLSFLAQALVNRDFAEFLDAPQIPLGQKTELISNTLGNAVGPLARNLVSLLSSRNLAHLLPEVAEQYQRLLDAHRGIEQAEVVSAVPLSDGQRRRVGELLQGMVGKEIRLATRVDPQVLGGFVAKVGDRVVDGSTRTRLRAMRRELAGRAS